MRFKNKCKFNFHPFHEYQWSEVGHTPLRYVQPALEVIVLTSAFSIIYKKDNLTQK